MKKLLMVGLVIWPLSSLSAESEPDSAPVEKETAKKTSVEKKVPRQTARRAADSVEVTLQSTITGNREQPKVLYIVPWQAPDGPESLRQGFQSDLDELFQSVDRDEFLRQLKHKTATQNDKTTQSK